MKNWKTSLFGLLGGLAVMFGPRLQGDTGAPAITLEHVVQAAAILGIGLSAKDHNVTGGSVKQ